VGDAIPDFLYNTYDNLGHLTEVQMRQSGVLEKQTYEYDPVGRLTSAVGTGTAAYDYDYTYDAGGNLATRINRTPNPDQTRTYTYGTPGDHHAHAVMSISGSMTASYSYDANGNMGTRTEILGTYTQTFDVENRLTKVTREAGANDQIAEFYYDADGNRILTIYKTGPTETSRVYTPYPDYEESVPATGGVTKRVSYFLAGQLIAVRVITATTNNYYYAFADQLGNVAGYYKVDDQFLSNSLARYDPYGVYRTEPPASVNPDISDRGYTGHRMNNTGTYDLGLIYMNARYYLPEVGRFISADTIVPEPKNPQTYNRYSYALNSPTNFTDPSGHCTSNYEIGSQEMDTCVAAWSAVTNYLSGAAFGAGGSGQFPNELVSDWLANADIGTLENLMDVFGIGYGYTFTPPQGYSSSYPTRNARRVSENLCDYWESCYEPLITREEMKPDAIAGGISGSAAGIAYGIAGVEGVYNFDTEELSLFTYIGQGAGLALEEDVSGYGALIWNLDENSDYEGVSPALAVDLGLGVHGQVVLFWEENTLPFTGDTWGIAFGSGSGLGFALTGSYSHYVCQAGCQ